MDIDEFRRAGHELVDWMADYLRDIENYPVRARATPGEVLAQLPSTPPAKSASFDEIFDDFKEIVVPGMTHWQHPSFFAYFPANSSPASVLAEMITATLGAQCMSWETSPAATELEQCTMEWLRQMIGLPSDFEGVIQDSASTATLCAILSAREQASKWRANENGLRRENNMVVYGSSECHSSVEKAVKIAGLGRQNFHKVSVDDSFGMDPHALANDIMADKASGKTPICVVAALGSTGSSAIDPLLSIADICRRNNLWLHVDAAWAGAALIDPKYRWMIAGIEQVDSFVFNPHKWLFTNFDCSAYFVRAPEALLKTLSILPEYLKSQGGDDVRNYRDWSVPLGRRFRSLKLWFVIRSYGVARLRQMIQAHIELAQELAAQIDMEDDFERLAPTPLALVCFRYRPAGVDPKWKLDALNEALVENINLSGAAYLTHTRLRGAYAIRISIGQTTTERRHVEDLWKLIKKTARALA
ncbi:MAG: L-2,4-diaminobutyrate decarboxylase [Alphaproteobacteria bacterium MarineAlpha9_Bin7]|nr:MAG: L-2,4-diaminobutyrate decarboxylase [Alphaproteobacteria bacterium MarineAlpha9_Bin7]